MRRAMPKHNSFSVNGCNARDVIRMSTCATNTRRAARIARARQIFLELDSQGANQASIKDGLKSLEGQLKYGLNPDYNPRPEVGDNRKVAM